MKQFSDFRRLLNVAELAGLPAPAGPQPIDGLSLVPVLKDGNVRVRDRCKIEGDSGDVSGGDYAMTPSVPCR